MRTILILIGLLLLVVWVVFFSSPVSMTTCRPAGEAKFREILIKLEGFRAGAGRYPTREEGLAALVAEPANADPPITRWVQQFRTLPLDPWGNPFHYLGPSPTSGLPLLFSCGPDGESHSTGNDADDLNSWSLD